MKIIVPTSGGKDSSSVLTLALSLHPKEDVIPIFNDTGWEHPMTYKYLDTLSKHFDIEIHRTKGSVNGDTLPELIRYTGYFPHMFKRFCTKELKIRATRNWFYDKVFSYSEHYQFWFGMRKAESNNRARRFSWVKNDTMLHMEDLVGDEYRKIGNEIRIRLPIVEWSTDEAFAYLKKMGVPLNPLYFEGTTQRVGCYPCMISGRKTHEEELATEFGKGQLKIIMELEQDIGQSYEVLDTDELYECIFCSF